MSPEIHREFCRRRLCRVIAIVVLGGAFFHLDGQEEEAKSPAPQTEASVGATDSRVSVVEIPAQNWGEDYQVKVTGGDPYTRVRFSVFIAELRDDFRWLLFKLRLDEPGARSIWNIPVKVNLWGTFQDVHTGDEVMMKVKLNPDDRFIIEVDVRLHDEFEEDSFSREMIRAFLIEQMLVPSLGNPSAFVDRFIPAEPATDQAAAGQPEGRIKSPEWVVHGFDQLILHRRGGSPSSYYRGFLESGQLLVPTELFSLQDVESLDPVRFSILRASASAMVEALLDQPDGDIGLRGLLGDLGQPSPPDIDVLFRQHFPAFREMDDGLEKWWALELASLGQQHRFEYLDRAETERLLSEALTVQFEGRAENLLVAEPVKRGFLDYFKGKPATPPKPPEAFSGPVDQFELYLHRPDAKDELTRVFDRLQSLKRVGFPLYRPVFTAYENAILRLVKGDTKEIAVEFSAIAEMRTKIGETLMRTDDYLNHFEATRTPRRSDAFDDYLKMRRALDRKARPKRNDPITRHLDALEWEFR